MDYNKQVETIVDYFRQNEKVIDEFKIGVEFEHFVVDKETLRTISYYGKAGVAETLRNLEDKGYKGIYEGEYILGLEKENKAITLEPGSQLELSIKASINIEELEREYLEFLGDIIPILEEKNQGLITTGYHPVTKIDEIKLLPKQRYDYMFNYFKTRGTHAHNMMKGTSALQISFDYKSQEDYIKKFRVTNALSPALYAMFENAYYFEGEPSKKHNIRSYIWTNCDTDRSGVVDGALDKNFGYRDYAEYILNRPPIFINKDGEEIFTGKQNVRDVFDPDNYKIEELEHMLTMFFPDVRTKKYVEVRMMDAVPYPLNFAAIALLKGLLYDEDNLEELYVYAKDIHTEDIDKVKEEMMDQGLRAKLKDKSLLEINKYLIKLAKKGLTLEEIKYLEPLEEIIKEGKSPYEITKERAAKSTKKEALSWCLLNNLVEGK
ncbi:glutamate--cysteine ligase [Wansuia hejianensis]|uniref:Glutamate--cysteine ligase n=1 Tax=Wansuia hejianensis TaxID=2763667 RepID=A0A926INS0_9FIRM|nr:glutamate-cysteine ligase family protein [Wansuia hejianensis]MBC8590968.1 glutamate--cysteine ligase [Wansuia hejianensis]